MPVLLYNYKRLVISSRQNSNYCAAPHPVPALLYERQSSAPSDERLSRTASATDGFHTPCTCSVINMNVSHELHQTRDWADLQVTQLALSSVQFKVVFTRSGKPIIMRCKSSPRNFPKVAFQTVLAFIDDGHFSSFQKDHRGSHPPCTCPVIRAPSDTRAEVRGCDLKVLQWLPIHLSD